MENPRAYKIKMGGQEYRMLLTLYATREISSRFGGIKEMAETIAASQEFAELVGPLAFLLHLLIEQGEENFHLLNPGEARQKVPTEEQIQALFSPGDVDEIRGGILGAITRGMRKEVESVKDESDEGN